jgi:hypothetical protein
MPSGRRRVTSSWRCIFKSLDDGPVAKSLAEARVGSPTQGAGREVRQLWQSGSPWPIYCDNGYCVSRLVSVDLAAQPAEKEQP